MTSTEARPVRTVIVNGKSKRLSSEETVRRKFLLREATRATVAMYRPALERLEKA